MARNGSGTYILPAGNPVITGSVISSTWANNTLNDISAALTGSIAADGQTNPTANLTMAGFSHINVGNASLRTQYANAGQVQDGSYQYLNTISGADTITAVAALGMSAYVTGQTFWFIAAGDNTGAVTLNINAIGAKAITKNGTDALAAGDIIAGGIVQVVYDGTQFQLNSSASLLSSDNVWTGTNEFSNAVIIDTSLQLPTNTTATRPKGINGQIRYNTTLDQYEGSHEAAGAVINTITHTLDVATVTTLTDHYLNTDDYIFVTGATPSTYNGGYFVTVTGATTFEYTMAANPGADAAVTGSYVSALWGSLSGAPIYENSQNITANYIIGAGKNASSTGPITVDSGVTVIVPSSSRWVIL